MVRRHASSANGANYIRVAVVCGIAGYVGLILWGLTQLPPTRDGFRIEVPSALLAMVTGGFYVYHLYNADRPTTFPRVGALLTERASRDSAD